MSLHYTEVPERLSYTEKNLHFNHTQIQFSTQKRLENWDRHSTTPSYSEDPGL